MQWLISWGGQEHSSAGLAGEEQGGGVTTDHAAFWLFWSEYFFLVGGRLYLQHPWNQAIISSLTELVACH